MARPKKLASEEPEELSPGSTSTPQPQDPADVFAQLHQPLLTLLIAMINSGIPENEKKSIFELIARNESSLALLIGFGPPPFVTVALDQGNRTIPLATLRFPPAPPAVGLLEGDDGTITMINISKAN